MKDKEMIELPVQETTSVYFNNIIRRDVSPITINELAQESIDSFNQQVELAFTDEAEAAKRRFRYLVPIGVSGFPRWVGGNVKSIVLPV